LGLGKADEIVDVDTIDEARKELGRFIHGDDRRVAQEDPVTVIVVVVVVVVVSAPPSK
jgi:hypothetical protein